MNREGNVADVIALIWSGLLAPRPAAARVIAMRPGLPGAALMIVLAYVIQALAGALVPGVRPPEVAGNLIGLHVQEFAQHCLVFLAIAGFGTWLGRLIGSKADFERVAAGVGFGAVLQSLLTPLLLFAMTMMLAERTTMSAVLFLVTAVMWLRLLAACIGEALGFANTFAVAAVLFGFLLAFSLAILLVGLMSAA